MVVAAIGYVCWFLGEAMTASRYIRIQMPITFLVTGTSAIACLWLIPTYGLWGAAIALIIASIVKLITSWGVIFHALYSLQRHQAKELEA